MEQDSSAISKEALNSDSENSIFISLNIIKKQLNLSHWTDSEMIGLSQFCISCVRLGLTVWQALCRHKLLLSGISINLYHQPVQHLDAKNL